MYDWLDWAGTFITLIFCFGVVLTLAYITTKLVAAANFKKYRNKNMRLMEGLMLGPQKSLQLVKVGKKIILLAISKDSISKIETLSESDLDVSTDEADKSLLTFQEIFENIAKGIKNEDNFLLGNNPKKQKSKKAVRSEFSKLEISEEINDADAFNFSCDSSKEEKDDKTQKVQEKVIEDLTNKNEDKNNYYRINEFCDINRLLKR